MKHLTLNLAFLFLMIFPLGHSLHAQAECALAGPSDLQVVFVTPTTAEVDWTEVPGAIGYDVVTVDVSTGTIVSSLYTVDNVILIAGLQPGRTYDVTVTTRCEGGGIGGSSLVRLTTNIVVVDVVLELNCNPGLPTQSGTSPSNSVLTLGMDPGDEIMIEGTLLGQVTRNFEVVFIPDYTTSPQEFHLAPTADYTQLVTVSAGGNGNDPSIMLTQQNLVLANFEPKFSNGSGLLELHWQQDVHVKVYRCSGGKKRVADDDDDDSQGITISPNPTNGWFRLHSTERTPLIITDMNGQVYYESDLAVGETPEIDATSWPNGTYIVRTVKNDEVVNTMLIKTE